MTHGVGADVSRDEDLPSSARGPASTECPHRSRAYRGLDAAWTQGRCRACGEEWVSGRCQASIGPHAVRSGRHPDDQCTKSAAGGLYCRRHRFLSRRGTDGAPGAPLVRRAGGGWE